MQTYPRLLALVLSTVVTACVPVRAIRIPPPTTEAAAPKSAAILASPTLSAQCITGRKSDGEQLSWIEDYGSYAIGYAEFDDQGWSHLGESQLKAIQARLQSELQDPEYAEMDFSVIVFVHGWHHNAHDNHTWQRGRREREAVRDRHVVEKSETTPRNWGR